MFTMGFLHKIYRPFTLGIKDKVEPSILENLKGYPLSHIPLILQIQEGVPRLIEKKLTNMGCRDIKYFPIINGFYLISPLTRIKDLINMSFLLYMSKNHKVFALMNNVTETLGSNKINKIGMTGRRITIAHLDTGIHPHADLTRPRNRIVYFKDFINNQPSTYDDHGHGTYCAGCIAGNGELSDRQFKGIAPNALLIGLKCLDEGGTGDIKSILEALQWVFDNKQKYKIKIVHMPLGINYPYLVRHDPLVKAVERLWQEGIVVICAAGNSGPQKLSLSSPGYSENVITVGCSTKNPYSNVCNFSSRGPTINGVHKPDLLAPGVNIISTNYDTTLKGQCPYISFSGTSVSSSIVTGTVALLLEKYPTLSPDEVKLALEMSCNSLHLEKNIQGRGLLDIEKLMSMDLR